MIPTPGSIFQGRYEIVQQLGSGGIGTVFKALQLDCQRIIALKMIHEQLAQDEDFKSRFIREARALNDLSHENIVQIYHVGLADDGVPFMAMEYVEGQSLRQHLNQTDKMGVLEAIAVMKQAAHALAYVHSKGIIHRDLKPENIILTRSGQVKIIDFGLAKFTAEQKSTKTGLLIGSAYYMSPEQCKGVSADSRSDIYSLTACFYEIITGKRPYEADSPIGIIYQHINESVPVVKRGDVDLFHESVNEFISKGMAKSPEKRFSDFSECLQFLTRVEEELGNSNSPSAILNKKLLAGIAVTGIFVIGLTLFFGKHQVETKKPRKIGTSSILAKNNFSESIDHVFIPLDPQKIDALVKRYRQTNDEAGIILYKRWLDKYGKSADQTYNNDVVVSLCGECAMHLQQAKFNECKKLLHSDSESPSTIVSLLLEESSMLCGLKKPAEAYKVIESAMQKYPDIVRSSDFHYGILEQQGRILIDLKEYAKAESAFEEAARERKNSGRTLSEVDNGYRYGLLSIYSIRKKTDKALKVADECLAACSTPANQVIECERISDLFAAKGDLGNEQRYLEKARVMLLRQKADDPADILTRKLILCYMRQGKRTEAEKLSSAWLQINDSPLLRAHRNAFMSQLAASNLDFSGCINFCDQAFIQLNSASNLAGVNDAACGQFAPSLQMAGRSLVSEGRLEEVRSYFSKWTSHILEADSQSLLSASILHAKAQFFNTCAEIAYSSQLRSNFLDESIESCNKVLQILNNIDRQNLFRRLGTNIGERFASIYSERGRAHCWKGKLAEAKQDFLSAYRYSEESKSVSSAERLLHLMNLAEISDKIGDKAETENYLRQVRYLLVALRQLGVSDRVTLNAVASANFRMGYIRRMHELWGAETTEYFCNAKNAAKLQSGNEFELLVQSLSMYAIALMHQGEPGEADKQLDSLKVPPIALDLSPVVEARLALASFYYKKHDKKNGHLQFEKARHMISATDKLLNKAKLEYTIAESVEQGMARSAGI